MATYFQGQLPRPTTDGFHAAVREFEDFAVTGKHPTDRALADAASEFAQPGDELWVLLYQDDDRAEQSRTLREIDEHLNVIVGEDYEGEFQILLTGLRRWVEDWDNFDYGW